MSKMMKIKISAIHKYRKFKTEPDYLYPKWENIQKIPSRQHTHTKAIITRDNCKITNYIRTLTLLEAHFFVIRLLCKNRE